MRRSSLLFLILFPLFSLVPAPAYLAELRGLDQRLKSLSPDKRMDVLIESARKEREVVWYANWEVDQLRPLILGFERKYPYLHVSPFRAGGGKILDKVSTEYRAGKYLADVILDGSTKVLYYIENGITGVYQSPERKNLRKGFYDEKGYWMSIANSPMGIAYNVNLVPAESAPKSLQDLLQPRWKGKMAMDSNPDEMVLGLIKSWGDERAIKYLHNLAAQKLQIRRGYTLLAQLLAAGEFPIVVQAFAYRVAEMKLKGAPLGIAFPDPTVVTISPIQIAKHPPHPHAAALFIDYLLSEESQKTIASFGRLPARKGVKPLYPEFQEVLEREEGIATLDPELVGRRVNDALRIIGEIFLGRR